MKAEEIQNDGGDTMSHSLALVQRLEALVTQGNGSDVSLRVQIGSYPRGFSKSPVFEELLLGRNGTTLVLLETAECAEVFDKFIRYLYCGEISLCLEQATPLHKLATKYRVQGLQQGVTQYMTQNLASPFGHASGEWTTISNDLLMTLLQRSDLILQSEMELITALEVWINQNEPDALTAENALRAVRYAMMPPRELFRLQTQSPLLARYQESVRDLLYQSYQFHSASPLHMAKYFDVNCSLFMPRNYLSPAWGSPWVINNPMRDDRSTSFQTQLGPAAMTMRTMYSEHGSMQPTQVDGGQPRIIITPATSSVDFAGVSFQKTVVVMARQQGNMVVRHVYNFHQSTEETGDFLVEADLHRKTSEYLVDGSLYLHIVVKPLYQTLISTKK
ncbi:unnamed protein product [Coregonus sp. 'balchen']|nr:unnamed protein product [Coregonus sp. 'balchen']